MKVGKDVEATSVVWKPYIAHFQISHSSVMATRVSHAKIA